MRDQTLHSPRRHASGASCGGVENCFGPSPRYLPRWPWACQVNSGHVLLPTLTERHPRRAFQHLSSGRVARVELKDPTPRPIDPQVDAKRSLQSRFGNGVLGEAGESRPQVIGQGDRTEGTTVEKRRSSEAAITRPLPRGSEPLDLMLAGQSDHGGVIARDAALPILTCPQLELNVGSWWPN